MNPYLVQYLEEKTRGKVQKLELLIDGPIFWRWKLEGIHDTQLRDSPISGQTSLFFFLKPVLYQLWGEDILHMCRRLNDIDLILDFSSREAIFKKFSRAQIQEADLHRYIWEEKRKGELCEKINYSPFPGPIILLN